MTESEIKATKSDQNPAERQPEPRTPRSIRFSNSEWTGIEKEAKARGMTAAELVRHAAVSLAEGKIAPTSESFPSEIGAQIERIYRGVYLLATLQRDEMIRGDRQEEFEKIAEAAREAQASIRDERKG